MYDFQEQRSLESNPRASDSRLDALARQTNDAWHLKSVLMFTPISVSECCRSDESGTHLHDRVRVGTVTTWRSRHKITSSLAGVSVRVRVSVRIRIKVGVRVTGCTHHRCLGLGLDIFFEPFNDHRDQTRERTFLH